MITALDDQVGRIVAALEKKRLRDKTLIIFSSDNSGARSGLFASGSKSKEERERAGGVAQGAKAPASNGPFRGGKGSLYEGGVRVPTILQLARQTQAGTSSTTLCTWWTSCRRSCPGRRPRQPGTSVRRQGHLGDGCGRQAVSARGMLINVEAFRGAMRKGDWKLVKMALLAGKTELFDLATDPGEKNNVADQNPEIVRDLESPAARLCQRAETQRVAQGAAGLRGCAGQDRLRPGLRHRRRRAAAREDGVAEEVTCVLRPEPQPVR